MARFSPASIYAELYVAVSFCWGMFAQPAMYMEGFAFLLLLVVRYLVVSSVVEARPAVLAGRVRGAIALLVQAVT